MFVENYKNSGLATPMNRHDEGVQINNSFGIPHWMIVFYILYVSLLTIKQYTHELCLTTLTTITTTITLH